MAAAGSRWIAPPAGGKPRDALHGAWGVAVLATPVERSSAPVASQDSSCRLSGVSYFVLDEADRMLDSGFKPAIEAIARGVRADRQTLMFSATWPKEVQELANDFLSNPAKVVVGSQDLAANHAVRQVVEVIDPEQRGKRLLDLLEEHHGSKGRKNRVMVFVLYKKEASRVESFLQGKGWKAAAVHGDASQAEVRRRERLRHCEKCARCACASDARRCGPARRGRGQWRRSRRGPCRCSSRRTWLRGALTFPTSRSLSTTPSRSRSRTTCTGSEGRVRGRHGELRVAPVMPAVCGALRHPFWPGHSQGARARRECRTPSSKRSRTRRARASW